jgi:hypothetical protein
MNNKELACEIASVLLLIGSTAYVSIAVPAILGLDANNTLISPFIFPAYVTLKIIGIVIALVGIYGSMHVLNGGKSQTRLLAFLIGGLTSLLVSGQIILANFSQGFNGLPSALGLILTGLIGLFGFLLFAAGIDFDILISNKLKRI